MFLCDECHEGTGCQQGDLEGMFRSKGMCEDCHSLAACIDCHGWVKVVRQTQIERRAKELDQILEAHQTEAEA